MFIIIKKIFTVRDHYFDNCSIFMSDLKNSTSAVIVNNII